MAVDINRGTAGISLPTAVSNEIWANTLKESSVMQLAGKIALPGNGISVPVITGEPSAQFVQETDSKPTSTHTFQTKLISPYTIAVIEPFSNQFRRDDESLYEACVQRLPYALAKRFDEEVFSETSTLTNFGTIGGASAIDITQETYTSLVAADALVSETGSSVTGWALSPQARSVLLQARDSTGRPLFAPDTLTSGAVNQILGNPVIYSQNVYKPIVGGASTLGYAGDWSSAVYGTVEGIKIAVTDQATINGVELFSRNMFAVRAEIEVGFAIKDLSKFVRLTNTPPDSE
jgi:HK97 family phage major capsid protein